jgi:hypothetical protein
MMNESVLEIQQRNSRVEADKAWETSRTRRACVALVIYLAASGVFLRLESPRPYADAVVPVLGYILSTLTFGAIKDWWTHYVYKKK